MTSTHIPTEYRLGARGESQPVVEYVDALIPPPADPLPVAALNAAVAYLPNAVSKQAVTEAADHFLTWLKQQAHAR